MISSHNLARLLLTTAFAFASFKIHATPDTSTPLLTLSVETATLKQSSLYKGIQFNFDARNLELNDALSIPLDNDRLLHLKVTQSTKLPNGDHLLKGADGNGNSLVITFGNKVAFGNIYGADIRYQIGYHPQLGMFILDQTDHRLPIMDLGDDGRIPPNAAQQKLTHSLPTPVTQKSGDSVIRLLVLYSPEFSAGFGSAITRINQALAFTNASFQRSGIGIDLKLARAVEVNFNNSSDNDTLLTQVTNGSGVFSGVPGMRDASGADMVAVLRFLPTNFGSGIAWINGNQEQFAFSVTQFSSVGFDSVFAHEIGHNLGSGHERASAHPGASSPCSFNFTGFSCGHGNSSAGWGTIMSRLNSAAANHVFSNPSLTCQGTPCGVPQGQANAADNRTSFNLSKLLVADFRDDPPSVTPAIIPLLLD